MLRDEKRTEAEAKGKGFLMKIRIQQIDEDIANGGDVYINEQLRESITRPYAKIQDRER